MQTSPADKKIMFNLLPFSLQDEFPQVSNHRFPLTRNDCMRHVRHDTDLNCVKNVLGNWVSGLQKCGKVKFVCLFVFINTIVYSDIFLHLPQLHLGVFHQRARIPLSTLQILQN